MEFLNAWRHIARVAAGREFQLGIAPGRSGRLGLLRHPGFDELEVVCADLSAAKASRLLDLLTMKFAHWPGFIAEKNHSHPQTEGRYSLYIVFQHWTRGDQEGFLAEVPSMPCAIPDQLLPEKPVQDPLVSAFANALSAEYSPEPLGEITQPNYRAVQVPGAFDVNVDLPKRNRQPVPRRQSPPEAPHRDAPRRFRTIVRSRWSQTK